MTGEVCVHHLWFNDNAYHQKGNLVRWNPAIKTEEDRQALLRALREDRIDVVATDHAPHLLSEKEGPYTKAASGGPMVQHSLPVMFELAKRGEISFEEVIDKMCHAPADVFRIDNRGYLRKGYKADIVIVEKQPWTVTKDNIRYKCGWSPYEGEKLKGRIEHVFVNGRHSVCNGRLQADATAAGIQLVFSR